MALKPGLESSWGWGQLIPCSGRDRGPDTSRPWLQRKLMPDNCRELCWKGNLGPRVTLPCQLGNLDLYPEDSSAGRWWFVEGQTDGGVPLSSCFLRSEGSGQGPHASSRSDSHLLFISDQENRQADRASPDSHSQAASMGLEEAFM